MAGFTFVGRDSEVASFRELVGRPQGELLMVTGPEGSGKSHLLRKLRREAESAGRHFVLFNDLSYLPDADLRSYAVIASLVRTHRSSRGSARGGPKGTMLFKRSEEFLDGLLTQERWPPNEKLLRGLCAAAESLDQDACLISFLDLGRVDGADAFPIDFLAQRLPERTKLIVAKQTAAPALGDLDAVTVLDALSPLTEAQVGQLLGFHLPDGLASAALAAAVTRSYGGGPLASDVAAKIVAAARDPARGMDLLPAERGALCQGLLATLDEKQQHLARCVARIPSGVGIASLRATTGFGDDDLQRLLRSDGIRNILVTQRTPDGPQAHLFHEAFADAALAGGEDGEEADRDFHRRAAAFFLGLVERDNANIVALNAHTDHLHRGGDKRQFIADFPKTYKIKHTFRLLDRLAADYTILMQYCDELGETNIRRAACLANLGRVRQELRQHDQALDCFRQALELCEQRGDTSGAAEQHANLASALQALGRLDQAIENLERAAALDQQSGNEAGLAADWNHLGIIHQQLGQLEKALECHQQALALHERLSNDIGRANQLANMAAIHRERGDLADARECYQRAWRIDALTNSAAAQVADLCNLGLIFDDLDEMDKAVSCYEQALELDRAVADREGEADHLRTLAGLEQKRGNHEQGIRILQQALDIDRSIRRRREEALDLVALAAAFRAKGDLDFARQLYDRVARFCAEAGDADNEAVARRAIERIDRQLRGEPAGEEDDAEPARPPEPTKAFYREAAGDEAWANLRLIDDEPDGPPDHLLSPVDSQDGDEPPFTTGAGSATLLELTAEVENPLRRERDEALRRVAALEAELEEYKRIVESLRKIISKSLVPD